MFQETKTNLKNKKTTIELFLEKKKSKIIFLVFLGGFIFDVITLSSVDILLGNIFLSGYLFLALFSIIIMNWGDYRDIKNKFFYKFYQYSPFITQFSFGALFSGFVVYYTTSSLLLVSWPFLLFLYLFFIFNEKIKKYYEKFEFQISVFFLSFFSFNIFFIPIISKKIGHEIFVASGFISLFFMFFIVKGIFYIIPILKKKKKKIIMNILLIFIIFNLTYFFEIIPPVPLSLKELKIVYFVEKKGKDFFITEEVRKWDDFYNYFNNLKHKRPNQKIYAYLSIFAPKGLKTSIIHEWEYFDLEQEKWIFIYKLEYNILGGRDGGYRGFSSFTNLKDGKWRINIKNNYGVLIGRKKFEIKNTYNDLELKTRISN